MTVDKKQKGMTLLEVLVSMLLIGIAIVGSIAMLQMSVRYNQNANSQTMALYAAQEMMNKMRANMAGANYYLKDASAQGIQSLAKAAQTDCTDDCSPREWANNDWSTWARDLYLMLPNAQAMVINPGKSFPAGTYEIMICWDVSENDKDMASIKETDQNKNLSCRQKSATQPGKVAILFSL